MKKIAYDNVRLDSLKVIEDNKAYLKVAAVITKEGVYKYPDGMAFKCRKELLKAVPSAMSAKLTILDHPDSMVIMSQDQIYGFIEKPFFDNDKIRAVLAFNKKTTPPDFLDKVKAGQMRDVSIGFYYRPEFLKGNWQGKPYDYIMRDIMIDHVAAGVLKGRCSFPSCGIGVDTMMRRLGLEHWGEYSSFEECVSANQDKGDPEAYCASIHHDGNKLKRGEKTMSETHEEEQSEFEKCVSERLAEGANAEPPITREQAEALCKPASEPEDEPEPHSEQLDQEEEGGEPDLTPFQKCVNTKMSDGVSREDAEAECRLEHPVAEEDQQAEETEPTPMERCLKGRKDEGLSDEEAREWCEAELAGEHQEADALIDQNQQLLKMKRNKDIEERRSNRRHPL